MGTIFKNDSEIEKATQQVEALMSKLDLRLNSSAPMYLYHKDKGGKMIDTETGEASCSFPRMFDSERIAVTEESE